MHHAPKLSWTMYPPHALAGFSVHCMSQSTCPQFPTLRCTVWALSWDGPWPAKATHGRTAGGMPFNIICRISHDIGSVDGGRSSRPVGSSRLIGLFLSERYRLVSPAENPLGSTCTHRPSDGE